MGRLVRGHHTDDPPGTLALLLDADAPDESLVHLLERSSRLRAVTHRVLDTTDSRTQARLISVLVQAHSPPSGAWDRLVALTADPDPEVRSEAMWALAHISAHQRAPDWVVDRLLVLVSDPDASVRSAGADALVGVGEHRKAALDRVWDRLVELSDEYDAEVRSRALGHTDRHRHVSAAPRPHVEPHDRTDRRPRP